MVEKTPWLDVCTYSLLMICICIIGFPLYYMVVAATQSLEQVSSVPMSLVPGDQLFVNIKSVWSKGEIPNQLFNSLIMALGITFGKISISILSAFAITYFDFRFRKTAFWMIFLTLMLPVEVRILPTYEVAANIFRPINSMLNVIGLNATVEWSLLNSYAGLTFPLIASATATFLFRQFFLTVPDELTDAAKIDGATPMQYFSKILLPLSKGNIAALVVIIFVYGWNQYLWPLLVTTDPEMKTAIVGISDLIPQADDAPEWNIAMAGSLLVLLPPIAVVTIMQKWFVKGLIDQDK